ncbi:hypothetical protein PoB_007415200 [Plakobranchus ocellatus]|uniref:Uncharacterized protein n=1 Tax=Plakobranchus ocellatus TaxID=259542 RepID=A0AAV4DUE9_9GAST|nr:hypothetical protein PoB_007415200 [Plakobranchus ocellatus]
MTSSVASSVGLRLLRHQSFKLAMASRVASSVGLRLLRHQSFKLAMTSRVASSVGLRLAFLLCGVCVGKRQIASACVVLLSGNGQWTSRRVDC